MRNTDIAILSVSVHHIPIFCRNGLTYFHSFFTTRYPNHCINICEIPMGSLTVGR